MLIVFILICLAAGFIGAYFTSLSVKTWYKTIQKPSWTPPDKVFAPVWTVLYIMMAVAAWKVWLKTESLMNVEMIIFLCQLLLNTVWSILFFGYRNPFLALIEMAALWLAITATVILFFPIDLISGLLLLPYLLWVSFAFVLNFTIVRMNHKN